tara:strand:+ start:128 stop:667 length:540 start_codon:yes stop_codon:yes gene_type:complete
MCCRYQRVVTITGAKRSLLNVPFNVDQTTLDPVVYPAQEFKVEAIDELLEAKQVQASHFGNVACYRPGSDTIILPKPRTFSSQYNYYATLLHELTHWMGGKQEPTPRACFDRYTDDVKAQAQEELVAEIGSVLLTVHFGLRGELENHASYVQSLKEHLTPAQIMRATPQAAKAFEWLIN